MDSVTCKIESLGLALVVSLGRRAHLLGFDIGSNPYERHSEEWDAFNWGWLAAARDSKADLDTAA